MWKPRKQNTKCALFVEAVEAASAQRLDFSLPGDLIAALRSDLAEHAESCAACAVHIDELLTARNILRSYKPTTNFDAPWFTARVMAKISSEEQAVKGQEAIWNVLARLASRLAGMAALAIILASGLLMKRQAENPNAATAESLFDTSQTQSSHEDVLGSVSEQAR